MKYIESVTVELKSILTEDVKLEIIAFLNSYLGGTIYIGVDDEGNVLNNINNFDEIESKIISWIRDEAIYPNCSNFVKIINDNNVLEINIIPGNEKPYYLKEKGLKPSGVYTRYGRNKSQTTPEEIRRMILETEGISYEDMYSKNQNLTFRMLELKHEELNLDFKEFKMTTSGFIVDNKYTNLAFLFSDQYDIDVKVGVYQGVDRAVFKSKKEFNGSIIKQIDNVLNYFHICNETRVVIDSIIRKEYPSYIDIAAREAILNCYCHRDYSRQSNIKIEFFDDRCEVLSPGGFYSGLTLESALLGNQSFRNKKVVNLLLKLGYIENYATGISRIFKEYNKLHREIVIDTQMIYFKVIFPNLNFENKKPAIKTGDKKMAIKTGDKKINSITNILLKLISDSMEYNNEYSRQDISIIINKKDSRTKELLNILEEQGIIVSMGSNKNKKYKKIN